MARKIEVYGLEGVPEIKPGDNLAETVVKCAKKEGVNIEDGDIVVVSSKIVSKAENKIVFLDNVKVSKEAEEIALKTRKDPRLVQLILNESRNLVKVEKRHLIVETKHGIVSGIDKSNVAGREDIVVLLPDNPDESARKIREAIKALTGKNVAVIITDTYGRPLREGQVDMAIGLSGIASFRDYRGTKDWKGYELKVKRIAMADEIAAAAELVKGNGNSSAKALNMAREKWLFK